MNSPMQDEASKTFFEKRYGNWSARDQADLAARLVSDAGFAFAYRTVEQSWGALGHHAEAPEIVGFREEALADMRRTTIRRWGLTSRTLRWRLAAVISGFMLVLAAVWQVSPYGLRPGQYQTRVGELRMLELDDRSRIAIDSATKLQVHYTDDARIVQLLEGQAQFSVAHDPARPFKVQVGDRTIVALGTVFTVEYTDREIKVAMLDGRVAVLPSFGAEFPKKAGGTEKTPIPDGGFELSKGQALRVGSNGFATILPKADIEAATAWREGKVILRTETLEEAVRKMNRYSTVKLRVLDESLAEEHISGVFEAGNSQGFIEDVEQVLPIEAKHVDSKTIELRRR